MADDFADFDAFPKKANGQAGPVVTPTAGDDFANFDAFPKTQEGSTLGGVARGVVGGLGGAAGALRAGYYGAALGASSPIPGGAFIGAVFGGLVGGYAGDEAQNWLLDRIPAFRDLLGQSEEQKAQDQREHPIASFIGGLVPYAIAMSPAAALEKLPEDATRFRKLLNNPYTARLMSGGIVGGMQLGQEEVEQEHVSWPRVAIATAFGLVFNKPNRIGERISGIPAKPPTTTGPPGPPEPPPPQGALGPALEELPGHDFEIPTTAQIGDSVAGPGLTDDVFMGSESRNPAAENAAITAAATEQSTIGPVRAPDTERLARQMEPELFERYDAAQSRAAAAREQIREFNQPTILEIDALKAQAAEIRAAEQAEIDKHNGYRGTPARRRLGAQAREVEGKINLLNERSAAFREGRAEETPLTAAARKEIMDANAVLFEIQPQIQAAYRAAADYSGAPIVAPPEPTPPAPEPLAAAPQPATTTGLPAPAVPATAEPAVAAAPTPAQPPVPPPAMRADAQRDTVAKIAYGRMTKAGEPPERAEWLSKLEALATSVRAARFNGALGDTAGLYAREGVKYSVYRENGPVFEVTPPPGKPEAPVPQTAEEVRALLKAGGKIEVRAAPRAADADVGLKPLVVPPPEPPRPAGAKPTEAETPSRKKFRAEGYASVVAEHEKSGMIENAEAYKDAAKKRRERGGGGGKVYTSSAQEAADRGMTVKEVNQERAALEVQEGKRFDEAIANGDIHPDEVPAEIRPMALEAMVRFAMEPKEALTFALAQFEKEARLIEDEAARRAVEDIIEAEEGHGVFEEVPRGTERKPTEAGAEGERPGEGAAPEIGEAARETEQDITETFQQRPPDFSGAEKVFEHNGATVYKLQRPGRWPTYVAVSPDTGEAFQYRDFEQAKRSVIAPEFMRPEPAAPGERPPWEDVEEFLQAAKGGKKLGAIRMEANGLSTILRDMGSADASTIIHELGHHWLGTLMRDALHPLAPQQLRDDAAGALRFLGLKSADELNERLKSGPEKGQLTKKARKAQERWATGVEQYFYEGHAPSPELQSLFDRFKGWLREVYRTIKDIVTAGGEHFPINDEFRGIMDRMLVAPDGDTVIMPETARGGPTIQDIHEADVRLTEPQEGEQVRDRVVAERDRYAEELPPQVKTGLEAAAVEHARQVLQTGGARPTVEGEPGPGGLREVERGGGAAEPTAPGGGGGEELGKVVEGGAPARPESVAVPGAGERGRTATEHPLAPGPATDSIPTGDTKLVDKAGNIRMENVTNSEKARQAMLDSYERIGDEPRGDATPDGQLWNLATELGADPNAMSYDGLRKHLEFLLGGTRDMAKKVLAARRMLKQSADDVGALAKRVKESWSDDDALEFAIAVQKHDMIQSEISGATASWGRTGRAFRDITEGWDVKAANKNAQMMANTGKTLFQIKQMASLMAEYDSVNQVSQFIRDRGRPRAGRMVVEYWINGLISGIQTHMTYSVGNTILALEKIGPETATAAAIGAVRKAMGREGETVRIGEVAAGLKGIRAGFLPAVHSSLEALRTGTTTLLPGEAPTATLRFQAPLSNLTSQGVLNEAAGFSDIMESVFGIVRGVRESVKAGAALQKAAGDPDAPIFTWEQTPGGAIPNFQTNVASVPIGDIVRLPSRMVAAIHSFFRPLNYSIEIHQRAYRNAANQDLQGAHFDNAVAGFISKPPVEAMEAAHNLSNDLTLMGQGAEWTRKLSGLINHEFLGEKDPITGKRIPGTGWPFLKFIDPFVHISSNIINEALVKRTPIGLAPALFGKETPLIADLKGRNGNVRADMAAARMLTGTAMTILFGSLAAEGYVTGSEPSNPQDAALWRQVYQAHSVKIGDTWYAMNRLGPMGMLLSTAADLYNVAHNAEEGEFAEAAAALHHAVSQNILDESFMRGPSDLIKAIEEPGRYGASYVRNFVSSFVPFSVAMSQMARNMDPYTRQARTLTDALVAKVPLLSQELLPRRDIWGEPLPSRHGLGADLTAIWEKAQNDDPVNRALLDRGIHVAAVERKIRNVQLTPEQYDDYARLSGRIRKLNLDRIVRSGSFNQMPKGTQHDLLTESLRQSLETAKNMMFMKYPSLLSDAYAAKMRRREGPQ